MVSQNCKASHGANPLYRSQGGGGRYTPLVEAGTDQSASYEHNDTLAISKAVGTPVNFTSTPVFRGIIYFNGTVDTNPSPGFHLGRPEILKAGTKLDNGTTLIADIKNPRFDTIY
jgi:hypothetical protein